MDVSIIIINYNTPQFVTGAISSIKSQSKGFSYEIIVVDNASSDNSVEIIKKQNNGIIVIASHENLGTSKAYNLAISKSQGDYIFLLNPDTLLLNNAIFLMLDYIRKQKDVAIVCGNLYNLDSKPTHSFKLQPFTLDYLKKEFSFSRLLSAPFRKSNYFSDFNFSKNPIEIGYACAAAVMLNKNMCGDVGFFDESIFMYGEEPALSHKLKKNNLKTMNIPEPMIMHFEGGSFRDKNKYSFSQERYKRFINGNYAAFEIIEGPGGGKKYYKILLRGERRLAFLYFFFRRTKYKMSRQKVLILKKELMRCMK